MIAFLILIAGFVVVVVVAAGLVAAASTTKIGQKTSEDAEEGLLFCHRNCHCSLPSSSFCRSSSSRVSLLLLLR